MPEKKFQEMLHPDDAHDDAQVLRLMATERPSITGKE